MKTGKFHTIWGRHFCIRYLAKPKLFQLSLKYLNQKFCNLNLNLCNPMSGWPLIFQTLILLDQSFKYQCKSLSDFKDKGIRKFELVARTQFLSLTLLLVTYTGHLCLCFARPVGEILHYQRCRYILHASLEIYLIILIYLLKYKNIYSSYISRDIFKSYNKSPKINLL